MTRILFYCHNVLGLGHITRSLQLAVAAADQGASCTVLTGCRALDRLEVDGRVRLERLPSVALESGARLVASEPDWSGGDVMRFRAQRICEVIARVQPHVVLVDHNPLGLAGELVPALLQASDAFPNTKFVWGVPYAAGGPSGAPPRNPRIVAALARYDSAVAYTARDEEDVFADLPAWSLPKRRSYAGWVGAAPPPRRISPEPVLTALCGGGADATGLCRLLLAARALSAAARAKKLCILTGPLADFAAVSALCGADASVELVGSGSTLDAIAGASAVVARAGYNTAATMLASDVPTIFVPYLRHGGDQPSRARRLAALPGIWTVAEDAPDAVTTLARALDQAFALGRIARSRRRLDGAERAARFVLEIAREARPTTELGAPA
jgi:predicted glycosyltransferase